MRWPSLRDIRRGYQQAGTFARAIVAKRLAVLGGLGIITGELVRNEVIPVGLSDGVTHWATVFFSVLGVVTGVLWAQSGTTPADPALKPMDKDRNYLAPVVDPTTAPHPGLLPDDAALAAFKAADRLV